MADFTRPRGTRDFGPDEMKRRRTVESLLRRAIESFGYSEISTPTFEHSDLFVARSGPQILDQIYNFNDKGGREIVLRPELTAPVMRFYNSDLKNDPKPLRIYYFGNCFRYERPQKGRYREFWQIGLEYIGNRSPLALSEVINAAINALDSAGLSGFQVRVGHVALLSSILSGWSVDRNDKELMIAIDKKDRKRIVEVLGNGPDGDKIADLVTRTYDLTSSRGVLEGMIDEIPGVKREAVEELLEVLEMIVARSGDVVMDPSITRGLDYYDGVVFEIDALTLGAEKQICGGGAYSLSDVFRCEVDGIGFALGFDRVMVALGDKVDKVKEGRTFYLVPMGPAGSREAPGIAAKIRESGSRCILETSGRPIKKALSAALASGADLLVIIGDDEIGSGSVTIKDLGTKEQRSVMMSDLEKTLVDMN